MPTISWSARSTSDPTRGSRPRIPAPLAVAAAMPRPPACVAMTTKHGGGAPSSPPVIPAKAGIHRDAISEPAEVRSGGEMDSRMRGNDERIRGRCPVLAPRLQPSPQRMPGPPACAGTMPKLADGAPSSPPVIPAKAGIHRDAISEPAEVRPGGQRESRLRGIDDAGSRTVRHPHPSLPHASSRRRGGCHGREPALP